MTSSTALANSQYTDYTKTSKHHHRHFKTAAEPASTDSQPKSPQKERLTINSTQITKNFNGQTSTQHADMLKHVTPNRPIRINNFQRDQTRSQKSDATANKSIIQSKQPSTVKREY